MRKIIETALYVVVIVIVEIVFVLTIVCANKPPTTCEEMHEYFRELEVRDRYYWLW